MALRDSRAEGDVNVMRASWGLAAALVVWALIPAGAGAQTQGDVIFETRHAAGDVHGGARGGGGGLLLLAGPARGR